MSPAEVDQRKAVAKSRQAIQDSRQRMFDSAATVRHSKASIAASSGAQQSRRPVILQLGPRDFAVLVWVRDEDGEPVYRVVKDRIKAASTAAVLARKLQQARSR